MVEDTIENEQVNYQKIRDIITKNNPTNEFD